MGEQTRNMLIGMFVLIACCTLVWIIMFLRPSVGDGKQTLYVRFANINQINVGTRVLFSGKPVGEVVAIEQIHDARKKPLADVLGEIYYFQLVLKVDSSVHVYDTDEITVQTSGLLGEKSISIVPLIPPKGVVPKLVTHAPIYAQSIDPLGNAFNELSGLSKEMKNTCQLVSTWIQKNGGDLGNSVRAFEGAMEEARIAIGKLNADGIITDLQAGVQQFTATLHDVQQAVQQMQVGQVFTNTGIIMDNLKNVTTDLAQGKGTLGRLITGDDFYMHLSAVLSKMDTLMNDVNHYGVLFHLNKSWQRQRAKQIDTLNALQTPSSFRNYFETEVSEINTAMSRIAMLIDKAQQKPQTEEILQNNQFRKEFRELLRQAEALSNNLKLYNQQLGQMSP